MVRKIKLLLISFLIVIIGVFTFMRGAFQQPLVKDGLLTISTSEIKNSESAGTEIRIKSILVNGSDVLPQIDIGDEWKMDGDMLVCYANDGLEHSVGIALNKISNIAITFIGQSGSGNVKMIVDNQESLIDLYRENDWVEILWTYQVPNEFSPFSRIDILFEMVLIVWLLLSVMKFWKSCRT